jgi:hypothetical protein
MVRIDQELASSKAAFYRTMRKHPDRLKGKSIDDAYAAMRRQVGYNNRVLDVTYAGNPTVGPKIPKRSSGGHGVGGMGVRVNLPKIGKPDITGPFVKNPLPKKKQQKTLDATHDAIARRMKKRGF